MTTFLSRRHDRLIIDGRIDLNALVAQYGAPLEVAYLPLITRQIERMQTWASQARAQTTYPGDFVYAYATKANFDADVVRTALRSGAHYETSAAADVIIAHQLWAQGVLPNERYMFCNGSKDATYRNAMLALREAGYERIIPIVDDLSELQYLVQNCHLPLKLGVRVRFDIGDVDPDHPGGERFGLTESEIAQAVDMLVGTPHQLVLYHAMVGSQMEDVHLWRVRLSRAVEQYAQLASQVPSVRFFNFGGGMPTDAYELGFTFDAVAFLAGLMAALQRECQRMQVPPPHLVGEFGRYTVASHSVYLMEVGSVKEGRGGAPDWYLLNGSLMVSLPDTLIVEGQQFIVLPLEGWDEPVQPVRLAGRLTCDTDDFYPRAGQAPLLLPRNGTGMVLAFFGVGAYQQMLAGRGGAHHCLTPEMRRVVIEADDLGNLHMRDVPAQQLMDIMRLLGYQRDTLEFQPQVERPRTARIVNRRSLRHWRRARPA